MVYLYTSSIPSFTQPSFIQPSSYENEYRHTVKNKRTDQNEQRRKANDAGVGMALRLTYIALGWIALFLKVRGGQVTEICVVFSGHVYDY